MGKWRLETSRATNRPSSFQWTREQSTLAPRPRWKNAGRSGAEPCLDRDKLSPGWRFDCRPGLYLLRSIFAPAHCRRSRSPLQRPSDCFSSTGRGRGRRRPPSSRTRPRSFAQTAISNDNPRTTNSIYTGHYPLYHTFTIQDISNLNDD